MPEGTKMSNGTPACSIGAVNARWLFPQERAPPSPPRNTRLDECEARLAASEALLASTFANIAATSAKTNARLAEDDAKLRQINARLAEDDAKLEALRARLGMAPSVHIPSTTTTWMSSPTAAGSTMLRIEEVCARQDAHLEALMADFRSFADDLDQRQPSTHASIASLDDDDDDEKDEAIHFVMSIDDDDDVEFEVPPPPLPCTDTVVPFLGGERPLSTPNMLSAFESATVPPQKTAPQLKWPRCRPCCRNRPRAPNHSDEAVPSHPQPMMGGTSTPTTTLPATSAQVRTHCSMKSSPMSFAMTSSSSPSLQPFMLNEKGTIEMGERDAHQWKGTCRWTRPSRVGRRHSPRAPNPLDHLLCGGRHRPRASNQSTGWASA